MKKIIVLSILLVNSIVVFTCFWDYDTIEMERQQFPNIIELISGNFLRHSSAYHEWRIKDREVKLKTDTKNLNLLDDLAVSYSKIGNDIKAIKIILKKDSIQPGLYETYANLGTFYIHNGNLNAGIRYINKAIEINPDAHFGREIYQKYLAEYIITKKEKTRLSFPMDKQFFSSPHDIIQKTNTNNFYGFVLMKYKSLFPELNCDSIRILPQEELKKAIEGIKGMMKFGNYDSPVLLEVLGDLLLASGNLDGARQLAARAYYKASYEVRDKNARDIYQRRISFILFHQYTSKNGSKFTSSDLEELLKQEIELGNIFFEQISTDEKTWIDSGKNPEVEFALKYYKNPKTPRIIQQNKGKNSSNDNQFINNTNIGE